MTGTARSAIRLATALGIVAGLALVSVPSAQGEETVTVFAAASLKNALDAVNIACVTQTGRAATLSYAASSALARQIEQGAPADVYISADIDWMTYLSEKKLIRPETEVKLLGNALVLVVPTASSAAISIEKGFDLAGLVGDGRLAMGDVKAVPAGKYGKAALEALGAWASLESKVAQAENVRAALKLVAIGEAELGIVYATDARAEPGVRVIGTFPADSHPPIVYPAARTVESQGEAASAFLECLQSAEARALFEAQGFAVLTPVR